MTCQTGKAFFYFWVTLHDTWNKWPFAIWGYLMMAFNLKLKKRWSQSTSTVNTNQQLYLHFASEKMRNSLGVEWVNILKNVIFNFNYISTSRSVYCMLLAPRYTHVLFKHKPTIPMVPLVCAEDSQFFLCVINSGLGKNHYSAAFMSASVLEENNLCSGSSTSWICDVCIKCLFFLSLSDSISHSLISLLFSLKAWGNRQIIASLLLRVFFTVRRKFI